MSQKRERLVKVIAIVQLELPRKGSDFDQAGVVVRCPGNMRHLQCLCNRDDGDFRRNSGHEGRDGKED